MVAAVAGRPAGRPGFPPARRAMQQSPVVGQRGGGCSWPRPRAFAQATVELIKPCCFATCPAGCDIWAQLWQPSRRRIDQTVLLRHLPRSGCDSWTQLRLAERAKVSHRVALPWYGCDRWTELQQPSNGHAQLWQPSNDHSLSSCGSQATSVYGVLELLEITIAFHGGAGLL